MNDKELWELMSIICEGQDSEQRRKVEQYITDLQKEIERLNNLLKETSQTLSEQTTKAITLKSENERLNNIINDFEEELERESNIKEEDTCLEHNTYIDINNTLKSVLKRFRELKGSE